MKTQSQVLAVQILLYRSYLKDAKAADATGNLHRATVHHAKAQAMATALSLQTEHLKTVDACIEQFVPGRLLAA